VYGERYQHKRGGCEEDRGSTWAVCGHVVQVWGRRLCGDGMAYCELGHPSVAGSDELKHMLETLKYMANNNKCGGTNQDAEL
jgi:hypothetical protein